MVFLPPKIQTKLNRYCPNPTQAEKANVKFYFHAVVPQKRVGLHGNVLRYIPQRSVKIKNFVNFILKEGLGMLVMIREKLETDI